MAAAATNPCASYTVARHDAAGHLRRHELHVRRDFVSDTNPLTVDLTIPFFSGVHIFQNSLFVGTDVSSGAAPASGTGPTLIIEAGNTIAFTDSGDYLLINRGSRIIADGLADGADHVHGLHGRGRAARPAPTTCSSGAASSSTATASRTTAPTRSARANDCHVEVGRPAVVLRRQRQRRQLGHPALRRRQAHGLRGRARRRAERRHVQRGRLGHGRREPRRSTAPTTTASSSSAAQSTSRTSSPCTSATTRSTSPTATSARSTTRWSSIRRPTATAASRATTSRRRASPAARAKRRSPGPRSVT